MQPNNEAKASALAAELAKIVKTYYADPVHRQEFAERYEKEHGKAYDWDKMRYRT